MFDEVHAFIFADQWEAPAQAQEALGETPLTTHCVGVYPSALHLRFRAYRAGLLRRLRAVAPRLIRAESPLLGGWLAVWCAQRLSVPSVIAVGAEYDYERAWLLNRPPGLRSMLGSRLLLAFERYAFSQADFAICTHTAAVAHACSMGARKVAILYDRVDTKQFTPRPAPKSRQRLNILCLSPLTPMKNQENLVRALPALAANLWLMGDGDDRARLAQIAQAAKVRDQVHFIRSVPQAELPAYFAAADAFATATPLECVTTSVLQAMASGLPLVLARSSNGSAPEGAADVSLIVDNHPDAFHSALRQLIEQPALRVALGNLARERALAFDAAVWDAREAALYRRLLSRGGGRGHDA